MATKLTIGKIVSTSTPEAWSQAYHAGGFTAVLALSQAEGTMEEAELHKQGKELLDTLIAEYFTLTTKDLHTVRAAVETTAARAPEGVSLSLIVGAVVKNILYIVIAGSGKAILKRGEKAGPLLELSEGETKIESVSGYLEHGDILVLETESFEKVISPRELVEALATNNPQETAEAIAPKIHEAQEGGASALVFRYHDEEASLLEKSLPSTEAPAEEEKKSEPVVEEKEPTHTPPQTFFNEDKAAPSARQRASLSHRQKLFITITAVLILVFIGSIYLFISRQKAAEQEKLFQSIYTPAKAKFDEGQSLFDLNKSLALEDFKEAKQMLDQANGKFPKGSADEKQISDLSARLDTSIQQASQVNMTTATKASDNASPLLSFAAKHQDALYITQDDNNFYTLTSSEVDQINKQSNSSKAAIKNKGDWKSAGGLGAYLGNIYVLDQKDGILKYVGSGSSFSKSTYFASGVNPDLSKAVSIAIDGSIWILSSDGNITKYTRGKQDSLNVTGLDKNFSSPSIIYTTVDLDNIYVADKGNSRLVVLKKDGSYVAQYQADIIKNIDGLDVSEKDKKAYILSGGTVYQIDLK